MEYDSTWQEKFADYVATPKKALAHVKPGQRVFIGALIGIVFHICNEIASHLGVVYEIDPSISVTAPTLILIVIIFFLLRERKIHLFQKNRTAGPDLLQEDEHE